MGQLVCKQARKPGPCTILGVVLAYVLVLACTSDPFSKTLMYSMVPLCLSGISQQASAKFVASNTMQQHVCVCVLAATLLDTAAAEILFPILINRCLRYTGGVPYTDQS